MARMDAGEVLPYASLWGPTELGEMGTALNVQPVHSHVESWETKVQRSNEEGGKYMFCALTENEYKNSKSEDESVSELVHDEHSTGFTTWHASMHDCIAYMLWCLVHGIVPYTPIIYVTLFVPNLLKVSSVKTGCLIRRGFPSRRNR